MTAVTHRPTTVSATLSVFAAASAILLVAGGPAQQTALLIGVGGLAAVAAAVRLARSGHVLLGGVLGFVGVIILSIGFFWGRARTGGVTLRAEFFPALPGLVLLVLGLSSVRDGWERWFVTAGTATVLLAVFTSGLVYGATGWAMLAATAATVVSWDLGEQAVNLGEQVGTGARTWPVELTHAAASVVIGLAGVTVALVVYGTGVSGVPLSGLAVLLVAAVVLTTALYN